MRFDPPRDGLTREAAFVVASYAIAFAAFVVLAACVVAMVFG